MYFRMLKRDIKDKPGLNIVTFIFMVAAVTFMVIGSTLIYAMFVGEKKTYEKCNSSDVFVRLDQSISDKEGLIERFMKDVDEASVIDDCVHDEVVITSFTGIELIGENITDHVHYSSSVIITDIPDKYDIPIDFDNNYFEVPDGCIAVSQTLSNRFGIKEGEKVRLTTQIGNVYEFTVSTIYKNPAVTQIDNMYLSDHDKEIFYSECPRKHDLFICTAPPGIKDYITTLRDSTADLMIKYKEQNTDGYASRALFLNNDGLFAIIVTCCMLVVAVAIMAMTMITIDFSLKSAIKREEREIGMMKAIGVWSLSYKTLFIVKYLFFAVLGGIIGLPAGFLLSKLLFNKFVMHIMYPDVMMMIIIGAIASITTILIIALFSFFALRRMNKISVIDAIHGENRGERFSAIPGLSLNKKKHLSVPLFLAVSDILRGFKRYILLIVAYVLGICIVMFVVRLNDTIMTPDYAYTHFQQGQMDFLITIDDDYYSKLISGQGSFKGVIDVINSDFENNSIPAHMVTYEYGSGLFKFEDKETVCQLMWTDAPSSEMKYIEGNAPKLRNEVAVGYYTANEKGIKIGDTVSLEYDKYEDDHVTFHKVTEEFIVTAFVDRFGNNSPIIIMGDDFEGSTVFGGNFFSCTIDAPASQHNAIIEKMQALYPDGEVTVLHNNEIMPHYLVGYQEMFNLIILIVSLVCAVVLILLTSLYENIFIDEETSDIALLKSMGFGRGVIRAWHFFRLMLLSLFSLLLTYVFMATAGNFLIGNLFKSIMKSGDFTLKVLPLSNFVIVPVCILADLALVTYLMTRITNKIQIWKVRNE